MDAALVDQWALMKECVCYYPYLWKDDLLVGLGTGSEFLSSLVILFEEQLRTHFENRNEKSINLSKTEFILQQ